LRVKNDVTVFIFSRKFKQLKHWLTKNFIEKKIDNISTFLVPANWRPFTVIWSPYETKIHFESFRSKQKCFQEIVILQKHKREQ
jgi:hypothetical protein